MGNLLHVRVHAANIHDTVSGSDVFKGALSRYPSIKGCCADAGYRKTFESAALSLGKSVKISERIKPKGWSILPQRWVVERTFSWLNNSRRLSKDYEILTVSEENMVRISHFATLLRRF
jgi:putative transposase